MSEEKKKAAETKVEAKKPAKPGKAGKVSLAGLSKQTVQDPAGEQTGRRGGQSGPGGQNRADNKGGKGDGKRPGGRGGRDSRGGRGKRSGGKPPAKLDQQEVKNPPAASLGGMLKPEVVEELKKRGLLKDTKK